MESTSEQNQQLLAENNRLKRLLARLSERELSQANVLSPNSNQPSLLPAALGAVLSGQALFSDRIKSALQLIDKYADCGRVILFHYNKTNRSHIVLQCSTGQPSAVAPAPIGLWEDIQQFLAGIEDRVWQWSAPQSDLPETLVPFFGEPAMSHSLLLFPLFAGSEPAGFLAFEETSFVREWFPFEKEILKLASIQLAEAFMRNRDQAELEKKEAINGYLLKIAETFSHNDRFELQASRTLETTARFFGFARVLLFENVNTDTCRLVDECVTPPYPPIKEFYQDVSYSRHMPGLNDWLKEKKVRLGSEPNMKAVCEFLYRGNDVARLFIAIHSTNGLQGFVCFEDSRLDRKWGDDEINAFVVVADLFASAFERQHAMDHMVSSHQEALRLTRQLKEKENFLENILSSVPVGIMLVRNRELLFANKFILDQSNLGEAEAIGAHLSSFYFEGQNQSALADSFYNQIHREGIGMMEVVMKNYKGEPINTNVIGKHCPVNGYKDSYLLIAQDVTTLKQAQSELTESEERYRKILETTIEGVVILDSPEKAVYINNAASELMGINQSTVEAWRPASVFASADDLVNFRKAFGMISQGSDYKGDFNIYGASGEALPVEVYGSRIVLKGKLLYYFSFRNIADRKKHEAILRQSEEKFRTLSENTSDQIIRISIDGTLLFANQAFQKCYNLGSMEVAGQRLFGMPQIPLALAQALDSACAIAAKERKGHLTDNTIHLFGQPLSIEWRISPEMGRDGNVASFLCSGRDITQRIAAEQELRAAKEKAESADRLKSAFLANLSHEVRTPLNAIVGFSTLLKDGSASPLEHDEFVNIIVKSSDHLLALISDIIDIAKIESGVLNISKSMFPVNDLMKDLYLVFQKRLKMDKNGTPERLIIDLPAMNEEPLLDSDVNRVTQVLSNLLDNAIKFTPKGTVTFGYRIDGGFIRFFVRDTGIGIDPEKLGVVFLPFRQGDESISKRYGGTGLGLSISKKLSEALGGTIHVESVPNHGSTFYFEMPDANLRRASSLETQKPSPIRQPDVTPPRNGYFWADRIVLMVDDNSSNHLQIRKILEKTGITLISARTVASARELIKKRQAIDLVLLDVEMSDGDVAELVRHIKLYQRDISVIAQISADGKCNIAQMGEIDDWLQKPLDRDTLLYKMNQLLGRDRGVFVR